jgi:hypothetical protein
MSLRQGGPAEGDAAGDACVVVVAEHLDLEVVALGGRTARPAVGRPDGASTLISTFIFHGETDFCG